MTAHAQGSIFRHSFRAAAAALLAVALGLAGCSGTGSTTNGNGNNQNGGNGGNAGTEGTNGSITYAYVQENWVSKSSDPQYPKTNYLTGLGIGVAIDEADRKGVDEIAAYFETEIASQIKTYESQVTEFQGNAPGNISSETFSESAFKATVRGTVEGAKAEKRYTHDDGRTFSFVVLDRKTFADNAKTRIDGQVEELKNIHKQAQAARAAGRWLGAMRRFSQLVPIYRALVRLIVQYNLGKPAGYPTLTLEGLIGDLKLEDILDGLAEAALQLKFAFRFDVTINMKDGSTSRGNPAEVESAIVKSYRENDIEVFVHQSNAEFANTPIDALKRMTPAQLGELLGTDSVNYLVIGTLETEYREARTQRGVTLHIVACKYDIQVYNVQAKEMVPIANGYGKLGGKQQESVAHTDAVYRAGQAIAEEILEHFAGGADE